MDVASLSVISALGLAAAAGAISFLSPCIAPLLPGFLGFITVNGSTRRDAFVRSLGFVSGFIILFAALGAGTNQISTTLLTNRDLVERAGGLLIALLGVAYAFNRSIIPNSLISRANRQASKFSAPKSALAAAPIGAVFAIAWTPCIGPVLAAILAMAASGESASWGAVLLTAYGIGLAIPFLIAAVSLGWIQDRTQFSRRHAKKIRIIAAVLLIAAGVAMATGRFTIATAQLAGATPSWMI